jgi:glycerol-3-phosphate acyltransferase PlsX
MIAPTDLPVGPHRVAVDAMGGDHAPATVVEGAVEAKRLHPRHIEPILVGDEDEVRAELARLGAADLGLEVVHAAERVDMDEGGADSFRKKRDSSLNVATRLVRDGAAGGVFSAGNTGAMVAASLLNLGRIAGVSRPAIATPIPTQGEHPWAVILDVGATADCKPINLLHFAILGDVYARVFFGIPTPRVGLLNIGEETSKGSELAQEAHRLLQASGLHFVGNVEGRDILNGRADVVVTDGFTGNVLLKFAESVWTWGAQAVRREIGEHVLAKMGAFLLKPSLRRFKDRLDYSSHGGAPLLGVNGVAIIGHGRSTPKAVRNALRVAADLTGRAFVDEIRTELGRVDGGRLATS